MPAGHSRPSHFDLMFERGAALRTWACSAIPVSGQEMPAEKLADHRLAYLDYEGEVSQGRGSVARVVAGEYEVLAESADLLCVLLASDTLSGELTLARDVAEPQRWTASFKTQVAGD
jgi:hypothetical protein